MLDYANDTSASTGHFQLLFKADVPCTKPTVHGLNVDGKKLRVPMTSSSESSYKRRTMTFPPSNNLASKNRTRPLKLPSIRNSIKTINAASCPKMESNRNSSYGHGHKSKTTKDLKTTVKSDRISIPLCHPIVKQKIN